MWNRLDPRTKLLLIFALAAVCSFSLQPPVLAVASAVVLLLQFAAQVQLSDWRRIFPTLLVFALVTMTLNLMFQQSTDAATFELLGLTLNRGATSIGALYCWRIVLLMAIAIIFARSIAREEFAEFIWRLLEPLGALKLPVHGFGLALSLAIRFIPTVSQEYERIRIAQSVRGARFGGGPIARVRRFVPILAPVVIGSLRRSEILADALTVRGWDAGPRRTFYRQYRLRLSDWLVLLLTLSLFILWLSLSW